MDRLVRLNETRWKLVDIEPIIGLHSGNINRITILDDRNQRKRLIYKEVAGDWKNEIEIYNKLFPDIESFFPVVKVWATEPEAILMEDLGTPLKKVFTELPINQKKFY
ncbi:hypothetical protein [Bacillus sp. FJAT-49736]|uniref:hypothetical protein n=1 Tax=Bacillus sp. FJAT-49736 TaxID=2833582 RepID=UPI001BC92A8F|nr:hypothetical protein [Bacillus sp. FJAT-49736]MBS4172235.1 hypothetical protein [Bacillus sp. FJAT-49736]